jgi:SOS-response transcriptional repressor LexA
MEQLNTVKQLVDFIKFKTGENQDVIALKAGYKREYLSDAVSKNRETVFNKLKLTFSYILENERAEFEKKQDEHNYSIVNEPTPYLEKRRNLKTNKQETLMYYELGAAAGNVAEILPMKKSEGKLHIGDLFRGSEFAIRISGNSMTPSYPPGAIIGIREIHDKSIIPGSVYVVEKGNELWIKRLFYKDHDQDTGEFLCVSDNTMKVESGPFQGNYCYPVFRVPIDQVRRLFKVTGIYKANELSMVS